MWWYQGNKVKVQSTKSSIICSCHSWGWTLQIDRLDGILNLRTLVDQVAEVLSRNLALASDLSCLFPFGTKLFDRALEADAQVVGWEAEDFADGRGDTVAIGVDVVNGSELSGDFIGEALGEGVRDLVEDVHCDSDGWFYVSCWLRGYVM